jgi:hypothetical protein
MSNNSFVVKNGLVVNGSFTANSTVVNAAAINAVSYSVGTTFTANSTTFQIGTSSNNVSANTTTISVGNSTVNTSVNATSFSGIANNSLNLGGLSLATVQGQFSGNAATAYANAVANAVTLSTAAYSNAVANAVVLAANAYSNAVANAVALASTAYANAVANSAAIYQTTIGLAANVATLSSNNSTNFGALSLSTVQSQITGNAATSYSNSVAYVLTNSMNFSNSTNSKPYLNIGGLSGFSLTNNGGNSLLNLGSSQYIQFVPGTGINVSTTGYLDLTSAAQIRLNGVVQTSSDLLVSGYINVSGQTIQSGTSYYINTSGAGSGAWSVGVGVYSGAQYMAGGGFVTLSDARAKDNIEDITTQEAINWINKGRARKYYVNGKPSAGFIAQEDIENGRSDAVILVPDSDPKFTEATIFSPAGNRLNRDYNHDIAYLTAALQDALRRIAILESKI